MGNSAVRTAKYGDAGLRAAGHGVMESVRRDDGTIESLQRAPAGSKLNPALLEWLYWEEMRRVTPGAVRFTRGAIRVGGVWQVILGFGPLVDGRRAIVGGLFARRADGEHTSVTVQGFAPS
jgi:hypothetical protein